MVVIVTYLILALLLSAKAFQYKSSPSGKRQPLMMTSIFDDILKLKGKSLSKIKPILPILGFYAVMNSPIYGIGALGSDGSVKFKLFGSMTDFVRLENRQRPGVVANEYIMTPEDFTNARIDRFPPNFPVSAEKLTDLIKKVVLENQPRTVLVAEDKSTNRIEFVQRSLIFRFPDVITFQVIPLDDNDSTVAVHSYSIYGEGDLGVNADRVKTWIRDLGQEVNAFVRQR